MYAVLSNRLNIKYVSHGKVALFSTTLCAPRFSGINHPFSLLLIPAENISRLKIFLFAITCRQYDPPQRIHLSLHRFHSVSFYFSIILFWNYIKLFSPYNSVKESKRGERQMRERVAPLGDKNIVGATVTRLRLEQGITQKALMAKMQTFGADISYSSLSKLEGQTRSVSDREVYALARSLEVEISALFSVK